MKKPIIVWGGSGQLVVLEEFINEIGYKILAVIDNDESINAQIQGVNTYYKKTGLEEYLTVYQGDNLGFVVAIGGDKGKERCDISGMLVSYGLYPVKAIDPRACVTKTATLGVGCQVMVNSIVGAKTIVGDYSILNTGSIVEHECRLGAGVHIGPGATLAGLVEVGDCSFVGAGAVILPRVTIGMNSVIGAGSIVTKDIPDNVVCYGNPARIKKYRSNYE